ncbi:hypothetical protein M011DRAFT_464340 [Sporormia fimetaria CBS 119925]|uniref:Uncharacterized protein n=1 Tax=Sporormia fimetaria CBS 119925 TaxID=1340428 RepID=A0A6A6VN22_9PLEO|nr:hypothetical protein M011DRAFT_464340 [Sporormia fimetaria CBS 119925]
MRGARSVSSTFSDKPASFPLATLAFLVYTMIALPHNHQSPTHQRRTAQCRPNTPSRFLRDSWHGSSVPSAEP